MLVKYSNAAVVFECEERNPHLILLEVTPNVYLLKWELDEHFGQEWIVGVVLSLENVSSTSLAFGLRNHDFLDDLYEQSKSITFSKSQFAYMK
jgi:hypothetical protein